MLSNTVIVGNTVNHVYFGYGHECQFYWNSGSKGSTVHSYDYVYIENSNLADPCVDDFCALTLVLL
jgi:hypothetical protein